MSVGGRWGWVAGPVAVQAVYAPALVVFIGGGPGGFGGNVGWFPLGPREVYVPSYHVSQAYVTRVNISSTTVNVTQVTNVYNTTIINNTTNITNITYANRNVQGAVMVVPQHAFVSAQPVAKVSVTVSAQRHRRCADERASLPWPPRERACSAPRLRPRATWLRLRPRSRAGRSSPRKLHLRRRCLLRNSSRRWRRIPDNRWREAKCRRCVRPPLRRRGRW